jgi:hypothetical protein
MEDTARRYINWIKYLEEWKDTPLDEVEKRHLGDPWYVLNTLLAGMLMAQISVLALVMKTSA